MSERINHIQEQIDYQQQRKREAMEVYYDATDRLTELEFQRRALLGTTAIRPMLRVIEGGRNGTE